MNEIKEMIAKYGENTNFEQQMGLSNEGTSYRYYRVLYIEAPLKPIHLVSSEYVSEPNNENLIIKIWRNLDPWDLEKNLLLFSIYNPMFSDQEISQVFSHQINQRNEFDQLFKKTNGFIIYNHQVSMLYQIIKGDRLEGEEFARDLNKKKRDAIEAFRSVSLWGHSVTELLQNRKFQFTCHPKYQSLNNYITFYLNAL